MGRWLATNRYTAIGCIVALAILGLQSAQAAQESSWDRLQIAVAGYRPSIDSRVRLDSTSLVPGTELDLENDLALEDSDVLWQAFGKFRILSGFSAEFSYFEIGRSEQSTLDAEVRFGDTTFPISADVATALDVDITALSFRYSLIETDALEVGASLGVYLMALEAGIQTVGANLTESADVDAPLPLAGLGFAWNLSPKLQFGMHGQYLSVDIEDLDGSIGNYRAGLQYRAFEHLGIGVGYEIFDLDVESEHVDFPGSFEFEFAGPKAFLTMRF